MTKILLIETATEVCSAAIAVNGTVVALAEDLHQPNHAARLTRLIEQCTRESGVSLAELDAVAVSRGPGSYTSLRVGASVAKGICYALDKPLIAVDTLLALAAAAHQARGARTGEGEPDTTLLRTSTARQTEGVLFLPMLDARRQEVWTAVYDEQFQEIMPAQPLILENNLFEIFIQKALQIRPATSFIVSGNGTFKLENVPKIQNVAESPVKNCSAVLLAGLATHFFEKSDFQDVSYFEPFYMKMPNITTPGKALF